jgi:alpha-D-ribose 1-methylphosphonate 5-triphosphate synthase subunit PhnH
MLSAAETLDGGFADPVFDAQSVFRAVMDAMARPGAVQPVKAHAAPPAPLSATAAAVALTLVDHDAPLWLDPVLAGSRAVRAYLAFHTGAPVVEVPGEAAFALVADPLGLGALAEFAQGTQEYPDRSTTLIVEVDALSSDVGAAPQPYPFPAGGERETPALVPPSPRSRPDDRFAIAVEGKGEGQRQRQRSSLILQGPGIQTTATLSVSPLPENFIVEWQANRARFPRGVDIILAAPGAVACLPRSVKISEG